MDCCKSEMGCLFLAPSTQPRNAKLFSVIEAALLTQMPECVACVDFVTFAGWQHQAGRTRRLLLHLQSLAWVFHWTAAPFHPIRICLAHFMQNNNPHDLFQVMADFPGHIMNLFDACLSISNLHGFDGLTLEAWQNLWAYGCCTCSLGCSQGCSQPHWKWSNLGSFAHHFKDSYKLPRYGDTGATNS